MMKMVGDSCGCGCGCGLGHRRGRWREHGLGLGLRLGLGLGLMAVSVFGVSACAALPTVQFSDLERPATSKDVLPGGIADDPKLVDIDTVRFVGQRDGVNFFLAEALIAPDGPCVIADGGDGNSSVGCGGADGELSTEKWKTRIAPDGLAPDGEWDAVSENLYYRAVR